MGKRESTAVERQRRRIRRAAFPDQYTGALPKHAPKRLILGSSVVAIPIDRPEQVDMYGNPIRPDGAWRSDRHAHSSPYHHVGTCDPACRRGAHTHRHKSTVR